MGTPDLNLLPMFVAVAETSSLSAAARRLGLPKSSVSRGITALEDSLGVKLVHRSTRKVSLTTAGSAFLERVRPLVTALSDISGGLPEQDVEPSGELRLTVPSDMGVTFLVPLVAGFSTRYPSVQFDIRPTNRTVDLVGEGFDAALRIAGKLTDSTLVARRISGVESALYAAPSYLARRGTPRSPADLAAHDGVFLGLDKKWPPPLSNPPRSRLVSDDMLFIHRAVREGLGLGMIPTFLAQPDVTAGLLVRVLPSWGVKNRSLFFVSPPSEHVPRKVAAFRDFLIDFIQLNPWMANGG